MERGNDSSFAAANLRYHHCENEKRTVMNTVKLVAVIGLIVALAMAGFNRSPQDSMIRSLLILPLFPGLAAGLLFSGHGGNPAVAYFSCWIVDTGLYLSLWVLVSGVVWPRFQK
jgi:hypothetical protein